MMEIEKFSPGEGVECLALCRAVPKGGNDHLSRGEGRTPDPCRNPSRDQPQTQASAHATTQGSTRPPARPMRPTEAGEVLVGAYISRLTNLPPCQAKALKISGARGEEADAPSPMPTAEAGRCCGISRCEMELRIMRLIGTANCSAKRAKRAPLTR